MKQNFAWINSSNLWKLRTSALFGGNHHKVYTEILMCALFGDRYLSFYLQSLMKE